MSSQEADTGRDAASDGLVDATFLDALRLMWFPSSLPRIAMTLRTRAALLAGAICWFGFGGAVTAGCMAGMAPLAPAGRTIRCSRSSIDS